MTNLPIKDKPIIINDFISEEDANVLISEINKPSEINPYPEYYKSRYGGTAFPYNKTTISLLKKYALKANLIHQELNPNEKKDKVSKMILCPIHELIYNSIHNQSIA